MGLLVVFGGIILITIFCFMRGGQSSVPDVTGNDNTVKTNVNSDISLFHYTDLSERVESYNGVQTNHNIIKYCILAMIGGFLVLTMVYKCLNIKKRNRRNEMIQEAIEMTSVHNNALMSKGMVPRNYKKDEKQKRRKKEQKRRRKYESGSEEEVEEQEHKVRRKKEVEEEGDGWKQERQQKEIEVVEAGEEQNKDQKQKLKSGGEVEGEEGTGDRKGKQEKKPRRKLRWVNASSESE